MTPTPGTPLTPEEEAQLRRDMNLDSPWAQPVADSWSWWLARTLATLDHEREAAASREALRERIEALPWSGGIVEFRNAVLAILATEAPEDRDEQIGQIKSALVEAFRGGYVPELPDDLIASRLYEQGIRATPRSR